MLINKPLTFTEKVNKMNQTDYIATIMLDMDDVLARFDKQILNLYNEKYNDQVTPEDMFDWDMTKYVKPECGNDIFQLMKNPGFFRHLEPSPYAVEVVQRLIDHGFNILIVSDSPKGYCFSDYEKNNLHVSNPADDKRSWLSEHFPMIPQSNVIFGSLKYYVRGDLLVDDKPDTYLKFESLGLDVLLMDRPYNQQIQTNQRVKNLLEAEKMIYEKFLKKNAN